MKRKLNQHFPITKKHFAHSFVKNSNKSTTKYTVNSVIFVNSLKHYILNHNNKL